MIVKNPTKKRKDTKLESEGAQFLVLGNLLIEKMACHKAYVNFPGYDLIATNPETGRVARIQVKSRWATDYDKAFPIKNFECDFVVHVALNRGYRYRKKATSEDSGIIPPYFYIFPTSVVENALYEKSSWGKVRISSIDNLDQYKDNWTLIRNFLDGAEQLDEPR